MQPVASPPPAPAEPISARIAAEIRGHIDRGELRIGDRVPSTREIVRRWGVAMATATRVLAILQREGRVRAFRGAGSVVVDAPPSSASASASSSAAAASSASSAEALSPSRIVAAGTAIADVEGLDALSMRRVAASLGTAVMALYRHVDSKEALLRSMAEAAFAEEDLGDGVVDGRRVAWRPRLEHLARLGWRGYRRHKWLAPALARQFLRPEPSPNGMRHTDAVLGALDGVTVNGEPLDANTQLHIAVTLLSFVQGTALKLSDELDVVDATGTTSDEHFVQQQDAFDAVFRGGKLPHLARLTQHDVSLDADSLFEFGLGLLLDGLAARFD